MSMPHQCRCGICGQTMDPMILQTELSNGTGKPPVQQPSAPESRHIMYCPKGTVLDDAIYSWKGAMRQLPDDDLFEVIVRAAANQQVSAMLEKYIDPAMRKLVAQKEELVRRVAADVIGKAWLPIDIKNRCRFERILGETWETLIIDGEPVLMLFDLEVSPPELRGDSYVGNVCRSDIGTSAALHI